MPATPPPEITVPKATPWVAVSIDAAVTGTAVIHVALCESPSAGPRGCFQDICRGLHLQGTTIIIGRSYPLLTKVVLHSIFLAVSSSPYPPFLS